MIKNFKIIEKISLTKDVYELVFEVNEIKVDYFYGQFITFILPGIGGRAYSILDVFDSNKIKLIIKKVTNGKGSTFICESNVGDVLNGVGPAGHFKLNQNSKNKLFLGTGTGFVPLYNQINGSIKLNQNCKLKFIFGVSSKEDVFYYENLQKIKVSYDKFDFDYCLSREHKDGFRFGRITNFIDKNYIKDFEEFYICGNPMMINDVKEILSNLGIQENQIFYEGY